MRWRRQRRTGGTGTGFASLLPDLPPHPLLFLLLYELELPRQSPNPARMIVSNAFFSPSCVSALVSTYCAAPTYDHTAFSDHLNTALCGLGNDRSISRTRFAMAAPSS
jgi:hypothetical protein